MKRGNTWECPIGGSQAYTVTIFNRSGVAITGQYAGTEPLAATVWEGTTIVANAGVLTPSWASASLGTTNVVLNGSATAAMVPGYYKIMLEVTYSGQKSPYYNGWLRLTPIAAAGVEPPTYGVFQDLLDRAGDWLPRLMQESSETNFLFERGRARSWLDELIVNSSRVFAYRFDLSYALYYGSFPFGPVEAPDSVIVGYLAANDLLVKPRTIEIVTYKALALICEKRLSFDKDGEDYRKRAVWYHRLASNALRGYRCELDTNGDGKTDIAFNLGVLTFR